MKRETRLNYRCVCCGTSKRLNRPQPCECGGILSNGALVDRAFPLGPLVEFAWNWCGFTENQLRVNLGVNNRTWTAAHADGITFVLADRWSVALGLHPVIVWGDAWIDRSLNNRDRAEVAFHVLRHALATAV